MGFDLKTPPPKQNPNNNGVEINLFIYFNVGYE